MIISLSYFFVSNSFQINNDWYMSKVYKTAFAEEETAASNYNQLFSWIDSFQLLKRISKSRSLSICVLNFYIEIWNV